MGLRTGLALYGPDGRLQSYRSKHFASRAELRRGVRSILREAPPLAWIWLEGGGDIAEVWEKQAAHRGIDFRQIQAHDWRPTLLLPRQQRNGEIAKREADGLARRVIVWSEIPKPKGDLRHDTAEAILIGLAWCDLGRVFWNACRACEPTRCLALGRGLDRLRAKSPKPPRPET